MRVKIQIVLFVAVFGVTWSGAAVGREPDCAGRRIYMHTLEPRFNSDLLYKPERDDAIPLEWYVPYMLNHLERSSANEGFGHRQEDNMGVPGLEGAWFDTDQNSLGIVFHARMLKYPCLVPDYKAADLIYVPYFGGLDLLRTMHKSVEIRDQLAKELVPWLTRHPAWQRRNGTDHFWVLGRNVWDFVRWPHLDKHWGSQLLRMEGMRSSIWTIFVETTPEMSRVISAPKPTAFHPKSMTQMKLWQDHVRAQKRRWLFSFAGGKRSPTTLEGRLRTKLFWQCGNAPDCGLVDCSVFKKCETLRQFFYLYLDSTFCLHPVGDACTRRSVLDGMLAGCIPVVFQPCTLAEQFQWHLDPKEIGRFFVYIPLEDVQGPDLSANSTVTIRDVLKAIPASEVDAMRQHVISIIPRLVYGGQPSNGIIERPDFKDSIDIILDGLVSQTKQARHSRRL